MAYSNTKAMLNGAGEEGHILAGEHHPFTNRDIVSMLGVYILGGLVPLFLWGYEVPLVNLNVTMKRYCELKGVPVKWMHHDWNEAIVYAHINPNEYWPRAKSPPKIVDLNVTTAKGRSHKMDSLALSPTWGWLR